MPVRGCTSSSRILKMTVIVYDNKNLHITELEDTRPVFILFYLLVIKDKNVYVTYSMYKMTTTGVPSGTILAVHLQKCLHLSNEIRVMQIFFSSAPNY
jgi:hypothetical protein